MKHILSISTPQSSKQWNHFLFFCISTLAVCFYYTIFTLHTLFFFVVFSFENSEMQTSMQASLAECVFLLRGPEQMHFILLNHPCVLAMTQSVLFRLETWRTHIFKWARPQRVTEQFPLFMEKGYCSAIGIPLCRPLFFPPRVLE